MKQNSSTTTASKAVGIWIRVSTEEQAQGDSPEHHEQRARYYAEAKGWQVKELYQLEAVSGKAVMGHPEAQRMLRDIKSGRITGLIFSKLARLARNTRELLEFADLFHEHNADLISLQESIDTSSPAGRLFYTLIAAMSQWEREEIASRVAASVPIRAKLGKPLGGAAPFGYRWENRELVPHSTEAPVRKLMYQLFAQHKRRKTVARLLNDAGYRTRNGSKFSDTTVERLIRDPTAKGTRRANYTKSLGEKKHWKLKPADEWVLTAVEPIVPETLWSECNAILDDRRRNGQAPAKKAVHLFTGLAYCEKGHKMYVPSNSPKYTCYTCRTKIPIEDLEAVFHEQLRGFLVSPEDIASYLSQADETIQHKEELLGTLEQERQGIRQEMEKILKLYMADQISVDGFGREYKPLEARLAQLGEELPRLQAEVDYLKIQYLSSDEVLAEARDLYERWTSLTAEEKRQVIEHVVEKITIDKDHITIDLCYLPTSSEILAEGQHNLRGSWPPRA